MQTHYCEGSVKPHLFSSRFRGLSDWFYLCETKEALISQRQQREPLTKSVWAPPSPLRKSRVEGLITQVDWGPEVTVSRWVSLRGWKKKHLSLINTPPSMEYFPHHLLTLALLFAWSSLKRVCTHQVFPVACDASPLCDRSNALSLLPEPNNMFLTQFSETKLACQGFHMFHCMGLLIGVYPCLQYWETRPKEIPSEHEHTTSIQARWLEALFFYKLLLHTYREQSRHVCPYGIACRRAWVLWIMSSWDHGWFGFR